MHVQNFGSSKLINVANNAILETTYEFLSDHIIIMAIVQKRLKLVRLDVEYMVLLNTLTMKHLTTSLHLISDSAMLYPLKLF